MRRPRRNSDPTLDAEAEAVLAPMLHAQKRGIGSVTRQEYDRAVLEARYRRDPWLDPIRQGMIVHRASLRAADGNYETYAAALEEARDAMRAELASRTPEDEEEFFALLARQEEEHAELQQIAVEVLAFDGVTHASEVTPERWAWAAKEAKAILAEATAGDNSHEPKENDQPHV